MRKNLKTIIGISVLGLVLVLLTLKFLDSSLKPITKEKILLDTLVTIKVYEKNQKRASQAINKAFKEIEIIERTANNFDSKSDLSKLNREAGNEPVKVSPDLFKMIEVSLNYNRVLDGAFDISILPLVDLWSFGKRKDPPRKSDILSKLSLVGIEKVKINSQDHTVSLAPNTGLDLGGISKGYAVDRAIEILKGEGINSALVTTGSTTRTLGQKPGGQLWQVGIQHPRTPDKLIGIVNVGQKSISTSGDYQRFFIKDGRRYHHILHPKTGYPVEGIISVTVITDRSCAEADVLSTGIFVLGYPQGMEFIEKALDIEGIIITSDGRVHLSRGMQGKIKDMPNKIF